MPRATLRRRAAAWLDAAPAALVAVSVPLLMRLPLARVAALLERLPIARRRAPARVARARDVVDALLGRVPLLARQPCQVRAITLYCVARRAGEPVELVFGAGWLGSRFVAHCWLTRDGAPFLEPRDPRPVYAELYRIPRLDTMRSRGGA